MSLDVWLTLPGRKAKPTGSGIFVRRGGMTVEISREEWDAANPGCEPVAVVNRDETDVVFDANVTHNLAGMAEEAGIYKHLWRPEEMGVTKAGDLVEPLARAIRLMKDDPKRFRAHNPENGWGDYGGFVPWLEKYLVACATYPDADVRVSR